MPYQLQAAANLTAAIRGGDLADAQAAYTRARYPYEQFEVPNLTAADVQSPGTSSESGPWRELHGCSYSTQQQIWCAAQLLQLAESCGTSDKVIRTGSKFSIVIHSAAPAGDGASLCEKSWSFERVKFVFSIPTLLPRLQVLAPSFPDLDSDIDAREYSFDGGENSTDFKGFHRLERLLFRCAL